MTKLNVVTTAMSKELRAFVQMLLAEEYRIRQINTLQPSEIISMTSPDASVED